MQTALLLLAAVAVIMAIRQKKAAEAGGTMAPDALDESDQTGTAAFSTNPGTTGTRTLASRTTANRTAFGTSTVPVQTVLTREAAAIEATATAPKLALLPDTEPAPDYVPSATTVVFSKSTLAPSDGVQIAPAPVVKIAPALQPAPSILPKPIFSLAEPLRAEDLSKVF